MIASAGPRVIPDWASCRKERVFSGGDCRSGTHLEGHHTVFCYKDVQVTSQFGDPAPLGPHNLSSKYHS